MCGITGLWTSFGDKEGNQIAIKKMTHELFHRGPDDYGIWEDSEEMLYLGHSRLSILDLSPAGAQPMISHDNRYVISFNGEIYNHLDLKRECEKIKPNIRWRGHSDTEILLEMISNHGLESTLVKCSGMFSLALWDRREKILKLARDRVGEKPLYYGFFGKGSEKIFLFASELSSFKTYKKFKKRINLTALSQLINYQAISAPNSIFENIFQLLPGCTLTINSLNEDDLLNVNSWWSLKSEIEKSISNKIYSEDQEISILEKDLKQSIKGQSIADVSLGAFLSGGIDSSLITSLLQIQSKSKVKTFTIGFEEEKFNEAPFSKDIAEYLGTDHTEIYLTSKDVQDLIPKLNTIYSEPFADPSQIPTHLVCREARNSGLKIALNGDGGDELFGGYNRYFLGEKIWKRMDLIPFNIRKLIGGIGLNISSDALDNLSPLLKINQFGTKFHKLSKRLKYIRNEEEFYYSLISQWEDPSDIFIDDFKDAYIHARPNSITCDLPRKVSSNLSSIMMYYDSLSYLPNDILTKVDRAAMASSLETRAPFLDHKVISTAWRISMDLKINPKVSSNNGKNILKKILHKYVPEKLTNRPKMGFGIPLDDWLRGPLKSWAGDLLAKENIQYSGFLNYEPVYKLWEEHLSLRRNNGSKLWPIIMWQSWLEKNKMDSF